MTETCNHELITDQYPKYELRHMETVQCNQCGSILKPISNAVTGDILLRETYED